MIFLLHLLMQSHNDVTRLFSAFCRGWPEGQIKDVRLLQMVNIWSGT